MAEININISEKLMDRLVEDAVARLRTRPAELVITVKGLRPEVVTEAHIDKILKELGVDHEALTSPVKGHGDWEGSYRYLADAVIERFNPMDTDDAEEWICAQAIHRAADLIEKIPCRCNPDEMVYCQRCAVLGRADDVPVQR